MGTGLRKTLRLLLPAIIATSGCVTSPTESMRADPMPAALRSEAMCVERQPKDNRKLNLLIADSLRDSGLSANGADTGWCPEQLRYRVTYVDIWWWNWGTFLSTITVEVTDLSNNEIVAFGESAQDSIFGFGKSPREIIDVAVEALLRKE